MTWFDDTIIVCWDVIGVELELELELDGEVVNEVEGLEVDRGPEDVEVAINPDFNDEVTNMSETDVVLASTLIEVSSADAKMSTGAICEVLLQVYEV